MLDNFREHLTHWNLSMVAVDEAHCISQWGARFPSGIRRVRAAAPADTANPVYGADRHRR